MSFVLGNYLVARKKIIDQALNRYLPSSDRYPEKIHQAVRYSVFAGGKRIRPILLLASYELFQEDFRRVLPFACGLEMVHTYSLIHDDLPAMDNDDLRRGKPTNHKVFGEATAILAGDALLTEAFGLMAKAGLERKFDLNVVLRAILELANGAGLAGMISGQQMDLEKQDRKYSEKEIEFIHKHKTAALIKAAVIMGALLGKAKPVDIKALSAYGQRIGLAFQIMDDVLDLRGGGKLGKPIGSDQKKAKATYPRLYGLKRSEEQARKLARSGVKFLERIPGPKKPLAEIARYIIEREY